jgi:predicted ATPase/class 3 adenylate cyclase
VTAGVLPSGIVTFLFTDIEGSTRLGQRLGTDFPVVLADHDTLLRTAIEAHRGLVVKGLGDGLFAVFGDTTDAAAACLDAMHALKAHPWPGDDEVRVRMAVHTAEAVPVGNDYVALAVHQAARVVDAAHGGQILLTDAAADALAAVPTGAELRFMGSFRLKDFDAPVGLSRLDHPDLPIVESALRVLPLAGHNMPLLRTSFVGRDDDLHTLEKLVAEHPLVTVTGPGGVGKSRTASRAAGELATAYPDGVWLVELAPVAGDAVTSTVAAVLALPPLPGSDANVVVARHLENRRLLLVLDNCEHVLDEVAALVDTVLSRCPHVRVLATSRQHLGVEGEQLVPLRPLPVPDDSAGAHEVLDTAAGRLFVERATASDPEFLLTVENAPAVARICQRLDGMPLAIELAAARIRHLDVDTLARHVDDRLEFLVSSGRSAHPRHRTLSALLDWSHDLLDDEQRALFRRLAVFAGGTSLDAVVAVCADNMLPAGRVLDVLSELVDRSLVIVSEQPSGGVRYSLLETAREYAAGRLHECGEAPTLRESHRRHYLDLAQRLGSLVQAEPGAVRTLDAERDNVRAALTDAIERAHDEAVTAVSHLAPFWSIRGHLDEAERILDELEAATGQVDPLTAARLDLTRGRVLSTYRSEALERLKRCISVFDDHNEQREAATATAWYARALVEFGLFSEAEEVARDGYRRGVESDEAIAAVTAAMSIGYAAVVRGELDEAERMLAEARSLATSQPRYAAAIDDLRGWCAQLRGDLPAARTLHREALAVMEEFGDTRSRSVITMHLTEAALRSGDDDAAVRTGLESARLALQAYLPGAALNSLLFVARASAERHPAMAARIIGAVDRERGGLDLHLSDDEAQWYDECAAVAETRLGGSSYGRARADGAQTSVEDLVAAARQLLLAGELSAA